MLGVVLSHFTTRACAWISYGNRCEQVSGSN